MKVQLLEHTPNPERLVSAAAKVCYSASPACSLYEGLNDEEAKRFLDRLGHESPLEHVSFTFAIDGVSRSLTHQLVRHRMASFSQKSQRYVDEKSFEYVTPPEIESNAILKENYEKIMTSAMFNYDMLQDRLMKLGRTKEQACEDARYVLPNACSSNIVVTMNARELLHFFSVRCCNRAQWEIRNLADEMLRICRVIAPVLFKNAGADCVNGRGCGEGSMSCGRPRK
ncbi:MAG: FAD-dependent thymidylate synthase [Eubacterium sp.]